MFLAPSSKYFLTSLTNTSSFWVPADALPCTPEGFSKNLAFLYFTPPIDEPLRLGSNSKSSIWSIWEAILILSALGTSNLYVTEDCFIKLSSVKPNSFFKISIPDSASFSFRILNLNVFFPPLLLRYEVF